MYVTYDGTADAELLEKCEELLLAYILPNRPATEDEIAAFSRAVYAQCEHAQQVPEGVTGWRMGSWSVTLDGARRPVCAAARAILLNAGLLYRGAKC